MRKQFYWLTISGLIFSGALTIYLNQALFVEREKNRLDLEMAYFPKGAFLKEVVMGYDGLAADIAWLKAIQYYGKHRIGDNVFVWLEHIFNIITDLDPAFVNAYIFGALVISEDAGQPEIGLKLLKKGMANNPDTWQLYFEAGFLYYLILRDYDMAVLYFELAEKAPGADPLKMKQWQGFAAKKSADYATSWERWNEVYQNATDKFTKEVADRAMKHLIIDKNIVAYQNAVSTFYSQNGRFPNSLSEISPTETILQDPYNGFYVVDPQTGKVYSSYLTNYELSNQVNHLNHLTNKYRNEHGYYPESLQKLVDEKYIGSLSNKLYGTSYLYNTTTGKVEAIPLK